jgi:putative flavoprotein involved in K+ transport
VPLSRLPDSLDVAVIGGGQAALATGYYLSRSGLSYALFDEQLIPGGAWNRAWPSLRLFSPWQWSSLPGWPMPATAEEYPTRAEIIRYLVAYEHRYAIPVMRPAPVEHVTRERSHFRVHTTHGDVRVRAVISATGTWAQPVVPEVAGAGDFVGRLMHSAHYHGPESFAGLRVLIVGGGNSGAQIFTELEKLARTTWVTSVPPHFLPDDVDGRVLFEQATAQYQALLDGQEPPPQRLLGDVVMVPAVRTARDRGVLNAQPMFRRFTAEGVVWADGAREDVDAVIFATGFRPALQHLLPLGVIEAGGQVAVAGTRCLKEPRLWLVGYGHWTGFASATLVGVGRCAKATVDEVATELAARRSS